MTAADPIAQTIVVPAIEPPTPFAVCGAGFLTTLAQVEREVAGLAVATPEAAQLASDILGRLTTAGKKLHETRLAVGAPLRAKLDEINEAARNPNERIEAAKRLAKQKLDAYQVAEAKKAREAEIARQAEIRALEEKARKEQQERDRKTAELAAQAEAARIAQEQAAKAAGTPPPEVMEWDDGPAVVQKTETEIALEKAKFAPAVVAPKTQGVAWRVTLVLDSVDVTKLPDCFVVKAANETAIRATFARGYRDGDPLPVCPGCVFRVHREPVSTGKNVF